jgi:ketosteroid isomerase-like protein
VSDQFGDRERILLEAIGRGDVEALSALLTEDFLITTAGWIAEPADKATWLAGLSEHKLDEFDLRVLAVRSYGDAAVVIVESTQKGRRSGEPWRYTFRYTDVWVNQNEDWLLAVRHASIVRPG